MIAAAGLHPVLIVISGHALVGVMSGKRIEDGRRLKSLGSSVLADVNTFNSLVGGGFLLPVETTVLTATILCSSTPAVDEASRRLAGRRSSSQGPFGSGARGGFVGAVDVQLAHQNGLHPLPAVLRRGESVEIVEYKAFTPPDFVQACSPAREVRVRPRD